MCSFIKNGLICLLLCSMYFCRFKLKQLCKHVLYNRNSTTGRKADVYSQFSNVNNAEGVFLKKTQLISDWYCGLWYTLTWQNFGIFRDIWKVFTKGIWGFCSKKIGLLEKLPFILAVSQAEMEQKLCRESCSPGDSLEMKMKTHDPNR